MLTGVLKAKGKTDLLTTAFLHPCVNQFLIPQIIPEPVFLSLVHKVKFLLTSGSTKPTPAPESTGTSSEQATCPERLCPWGEHGGSTAPAAS